MAERDLDELAASISAHGVLQPILVRPDPDAPQRYQIIAGERRWRAAQIAGLHDVPVIIRAFDDRAAMSASDQRLEASTSSINACRRARSR